MPTSPSRLQPGRTLRSWAWPIGGACIVLAARLHEIHLHTGDVAINDQWKIEGADLLAPWVDGTLSPRAFFSPHFEHVPVWTRLSAWVQTALTGRWDPLVQTTINAVLHASFVGLLLHWLGRHSGRMTAWAIGLLAIAVSSLPHAWENITWGFQSQFPFALLFLFLHVRGSIEEVPGTRAWWGAQVAGLAGLFTLASMWMAPLAVVLARWWCGHRQPRVAWSVPLGLTTAGLAMLAAVRLTAPPLGAFAQTANTPLQFLHAAIDLLGWPTGWPGGMAIVALPFLLFALQLRRRTDLAAMDATVLALGVWGLGQVAALAYARGADYSGYVSRYGDLLAINLLASGLALARLLSASSASTLVRRVVALGWGAAILAGMWQLSHTGHAAYFHGRATENARLRREAVQAFLRDGDRSRLEQQSIRWILYQDVGQVTDLLANPRFRALLPSSVEPANSPDHLGLWVRALQAHAWLLGLIGTALALTGGSRLPLTGATPAWPYRPQRAPRWIALGTAGLAGATASLWPDPLVFSPERRWQSALHPPGSLAPLTYEVIASSTPMDGHRLAGSAPLSPEALRHQMVGTHPEGPEFTCTAWSSPFPISSAWYVVPYAGWPIAHGNGLRLRIEELDGKFVTEVACEGPNSVEPAFWTADLRAHIGRRARVVLYDGRTSTEAWVAAAPPIATSDPAFAAHLVRRLASERKAGAHASFAGLALGCLLFALGSSLIRRRPQNRP